MNCSGIVQKVVSAGALRTVFALSPCSLYKYLHILSLSKGEQHSFKHHYAKN